MNDNRNTFWYVFRAVSGTAIALKLSSHAANDPLTASLNDQSSHAFAP